MGVFPYDCKRCGGGYYRCASGQVECKEEGCTGSQLCWEERLYFEVVPHLANDPQLIKGYGGQVMTGYWNGTGIMPDHIYRLSNFHNFHTMEDLMDWKAAVFVNAWCESCFEEAFPGGKEAEYSVDELFEFISMENSDSEESR